MNSNRRRGQEKQEAVYDHPPIFNLSFKNTHTLTKKETLKLMNRAVIPPTHNNDFARIDGNEIFPQVKQRRTMIKKALQLPNINVDLKNLKTPEGLTSVPSSQFKYRQPKIAKKECT